MQTTFRVLVTNHRWNFQPSVCTSSELNVSKSGPEVSEAWPIFTYGYHLRLQSSPVWAHLSRLSGTLQKRAARSARASRPEFLLPPSARARPPHVYMAAREPPPCTQVHTHVRTHAYLYTCIPLPTHTHTHDRVQRRSERARPSREPSSDSPAPTPMTRLRSPGPATPAAAPATPPRPRARFARCAQPLREEPARFVRFFAQPLAKLFSSTVKTPNHMVTPQTRSS